MQMVSAKLEIRQAAKDFQVYAAKVRKLLTDCSMDMKLKMPNPSYVGESAGKKTLISSLHLIMVWSEAAMPPSLKHDGK